MSNPLLSEREYHAEIGELYIKVMILNERVRGIAPLQQEVAALRERAVEAEAKAEASEQRARRREKARG